MSRSLEIRCDWVDQPAAADALERRTWAGVSIWAGGRSASRIWDREAQSESECLYLPTISLAGWVLRHWWSLLFEPASRERPEVGVLLDDAESSAWVYRHDVRSADSALLLPRMLLYSDGREVCVDWFADGEEAHPHLPGRFVDSGCEHIPRAEAEAALCEFVSAVLRRAEAVEDERVRRLRENWTAIREADAEEAQFCRAAGRLGLDPYALDSWDPAVVELLESTLGADLERPLVVDFLEARPDQLAGAWQWAFQTEQELDLRPMPVRQRRTAVFARKPACDVGHALAQMMRQQAGISADGAIPAVSKVARQYGVQGCAFVPRNHLAGSTIRAVVGWRGGGSAVIAGPEPVHPNGRRFLEAQGVYHAAFACERGPRLVTRAHTWDQQAARAFAAELLAPRNALLARTPPNLDPDEQQTRIASLAVEYQVSEWVVRHQLENAGVELGLA